MSKQSTILRLIREQKTLFILIVIGLFLIELEIFALAALRSGRQSRLQVIDGRGNVIHETDGRDLSDFNKYYFEKTFGPFENYDVRLQTTETPFPFRAWFVAAVGVPIGVILLFAFVIKAYAALFYGSEPADHDGTPADGTGNTRLETAIARIGTLNIFAIGFLVFMAVFAYWVVPNLIAYVGKVGVETLTRYKWFGLAIGLVFLFLGIWIIYLRYLLAKTSIEARADIEKHRLELEHRHFEPLRRLEDQRADASMVTRQTDRPPAESGKMEDA